MAELVVDSCVWVAAFFQGDLHHQTASQFIEELRQGQHHCHLPYLVLVEVSTAILRQEPRRRTAMARVIQMRRTFQQWENEGIVTWYDMNRPRANQAIDMNMTLSPHLRSADSIIAGLAEELGIMVKTYDEELLQRYPKASS